AHCGRLNELNKAFFDTIRQHRAAVLAAPNHMIIGAEKTAPAFWAYGASSSATPGCVIAAHLTIKRQAARPLLPADSPAPMILWGSVGMAVRYPGAIASLDAACWNACDFPVPDLAMRWCAHTC